MLAIVELLGENKNLGGAVARNDDNTILVGHNDVIWIDADSITINRNIHAAKAVVAYRS